MLGGAETPDNGYANASSARSTAVFTCRVPHPNSWSFDIDATYQTLSFKSFRENQIFGLGHQLAEAARSEPR